MDEKRKWLKARKLRPKVENQEKEQKNPTKMIILSLIVFQYNQENKKKEQKNVDTWICEK